MSEIVVIPDQCSVSIQFKVPFTFPEAQLEKEMQYRDFSVPGNQKILRVGPDGAQVPALHWVKGVDVLYLPTLGQLVCQGSNYESVAERSLELNNIAESMLGSGLKNALQWAELSAQARVRGTKPPSNCYNRLPRGPLVGSLNNILGRDVSHLGLRFYWSEQSELAEPLNSIAEWFDLTLNPFIPNPSYHAMSVVYRSKDIDSISSFTSGLGALGTTLVSELEAL